VALCGERYAHLADREASRADRNDLGFPNNPQSKTACFSFGRPLRRGRTI